MTARNWTRVIGTTVTGDAWNNPFQDQKDFNYTKPCIVSISGMIGAGKDTMVKHLIDNYGFIKGSFSSALKDAVAAIFKWDRALLEGDTVEGREWRERVDPWWDRELEGIAEQPVTPRWVLQYFGTPVMRDKFHQDIWVLAVKKWLINNQNKRIVFSDTRFLNEFQMIHELGAITLGIYRETPKWLTAFYREMDERIYQKTGLLFTQIDTANRDNRVLLAETANHLNTHLTMYGIGPNYNSPNLHSSDVEHLIWPHYKGMIDNTGSLKESFSHLEEILKRNGVL